MQAQEILGIYKAYLDKSGVAYKAENDAIVLSFAGEENMSLMIEVDGENDRTFFYSKILQLTKNKQVELVMAATYINQFLSLGKFAVDANALVCSYEMYQSYTDLGGLGERYARECIMGAFGAIEKYTEPLNAINKGLMTVKEFTEKKL